MLDFESQEQSIESSFHKQSDKEKNDYRIHLNASIDMIRFLLKNELLFVGMMRVKLLIIKDLFLELLEFHRVNHLEVGKVILQHASKNDMMICSTSKGDYGCLC